MREPRQRRAQRSHQWDPAPPARLQPLQLERRSVAVAVGQRVRHSPRRGRRALDVWKGDRSGARWRTELNAVDLDVVALAGALEHVVERVASVAERVGSVGNDNRRLELHARSIARPGDCGPSRSTAGSRRRATGRPKLRATPGGRCPRLPFARSNSFNESALRAAARRLRGPALGPDTGATAPPCRPRARTPRRRERPFRPRFGGLAHGSAQARPRRHLRR
jgi:hypothetical protein